MVLYSYYLVYTCVYLKCYLIYNRNTQTSHTISQLLHVTLEVYTSDNINICTFY